MKKRTTIVKRKMFVIILSNVAKKENFPPRVPFDAFVVDVLGSVVPAAVAAVLFFFLLIVADDVDVVPILSPSSTAIKS